jgi:SPP1 gp7 family putative phage head morphogenesis protein
VKPKEPIQRLIERALTLERLHNSIARDSSGIIEALYAEIIAALVKIDPTAVSAQTYRRARVDKLLETVNELARDRMSDWHRQVRGDLARLGAIEGKATVDTLIATLGPVGAQVKAVSPSVNMMKAIIDTNPFQGETLKDWAMKVQAPGVVRRVRQQIQIGMTEEEPIDAIVRRLRGTSDGRGGYTGGVMGQHKHEAKVITRTAVTDIANEAQLLTYRENAKIVKAVRWTAGLDHRTCPTCQELDGKEWPLDSPDMRKPAAHMQCRCVLTSVIDWEGLGVKPPDEGTRAARGPDGKWRQIPSSTTYNEWLKGQTPETQDEILGKGRANLFRSGEKDLAALIRSDGQYVTLDKLEGNSAGVSRTTPPARDDFTHEEWEAVRSYTSGGYADTNAGLRDDIMDATDATVRGVDSAIGRLSTDMGAETLFRGEPLRGNPLAGRGAELAGLPQEVRADAVWRMSMDHAQKQYVVGSVITDKAFMSTSFNLDPALDASAMAGYMGREPVPGVLLRIKNGRGLDLSRVASALQFDDEAEVLLPRGSRYRVLRVGREMVEYSLGVKRQRIVVDVEFLRR